MADKAPRFGRVFVCGDCNLQFTEEDCLEGKNGVGVCTSCGCNHTVEVSIYTNPLKEMIYEAIPFVGYSAHVPEIRKKLEDAVDYDKEDGEPSG